MYILYYNKVKTKKSMLKEKKNQHESRKHT